MDGWSKTQLMGRWMNRWVDLYNYCTVMGTDFNPVAAILF